MALIECKECGKKIASNAKTCPHCGYETNGKLGRGLNIISWVVAGAMIMIAIGILCIVAALL